MTEKSEKPVRRKKPSFFRKDWNKRISLGRTVKKKRKWRAAKGRDNKMRLRERGYAQRPSIGWGSNKKIRNQVGGEKAVRVENVNQLKKLKQGVGIIIACVGRKKRGEITKKAEEMKMKILNKYKVKEDATN